MSQCDTVFEPRSEHFDAVVIGSGAGGSSLCYQLAQHGCRVLLIERGDFLASDRTNSSDPIGRYVFDVVDDRDDASGFVGGETKFYGSALYRMREGDFDAVEHENGVSPAWPISYFDLEPFYERAELLYKVHGSVGGDASEPFRAQSFPHPPIPHAAVVAHLVGRIERSGTRVSAVPRGLDYGPEGKCVLCPTCDGYYCQIDAKMDAEIAALRPALATRNVTLLTKTICTRVLTSTDGTQATGVLIRRLGRVQEIRASIVAVCAGLKNSAKLLRRSRSDKHPQGLGNSGGCLGRYLAGHSTGLIFPFMGLRQVPSAHTKTFAINDYYNRTPLWPYPLGVIQIAGQVPFWQDLPKMIRPFAHLFATRTLTCFYMTEALPSRDSGFEFDGDDIVNRKPPVQNLGCFL